MPAATGSVPVQTPLYDPLGLMPIYPTVEQITAFADVVSQNTGIGTVMNIFNKAATDNAYTGPICAAMRGWSAVHTFPSSSKLPMTDPVDVAFCIVAYFVAIFVFFLIGRVTGKLELRGFGIVYNFFLVLLSAYMAVSTAYAIIMAAISTGVFGTTGPLVVWNLPIAPESNPWSMPCAISCWIFAMSKLVEYIDTILMMLKHNYRQVTFLHLYHHSSIFIVAWVISSVAPGGDTYWSASVNSGIHVVMYLYYLLNLVFPKGGKVRGFLQRNKFVITYGQLLQFLLNFIQTIYVLVLTAGAVSVTSFFSEYVRIGSVLVAAATSSTSASGFWWDLFGAGDGLPRYANVTKQYPPLPMHINFWYMITMLVLFGNFLIKNKKSTKSTASPRSSQKKVKQD